METLGKFYLIETPFITFANRADPAQAAALSGSTLFAYGNMIRYDPKLADLTSNFFVPTLADLTSNIFALLYVQT